MPNPSALRREAAALLAEAERLESRPVDEWCEGTVVTFTKPGTYRVDDSLYHGDLHYAAIKAGTRRRCWFLTGLTQGGKTWDELLDFIGEDNLKTARTCGAARGVRIVK